MFSKLGKLAEGNSKQQQEPPAGFIDAFQQGMGSAQNKANPNTQGANFMDAFSKMMPGEFTGKPTELQQKNFTRLSSSIERACIEKCLRRERNYFQDTEICLTKCMDLAYQYYWLGFHEINQFAYENNIKGGNKV